MIHLQRTVPDWPRAIYLLPNKAIFKATENYQTFREVKAINPNILQIFQSSWSVLGRKQQIFGLAMPTGAEAFEGKH